MDDAAAPTAAGMYDYYLGGTAHTAVDRAAAEQVAQLLPEVGDAAWANRGFLQRAVKRLAGELGVRQFVDIGSGLPTQRNTHDVVAEAGTGGRVVYVDRDPVAVARGKELLTGTDGVTVIQADLREPEVIWDHPETQRLIDRSQPVAVLMVAVLHFIPDADDPWGIVRRYVDLIPSGSFLAISHGTGDYASERNREAILKVYASTPTPPTDRSKSEVERFFDGLELLPPYPGAAPGVTFGGLWGADNPDDADSDGSRLFYAGVGRKP
ncbi:MAG TPA: SAM-dependent methyltransferase [Natronosporangium sp.]